MPVATSPIPPPPPLPDWARPPGGRLDPPPPRDRRRRWLYWALGIGIGLPVLGALVLLIYAQSLRTHLPDIYALREESLASSSTAYTADGVVLARYHHLHRRWVPLSAVSVHVVDALIATEDRRFHEHTGVDWRRFFGAMWQTAQGRTEGGSTITMQLARNLFPEDIGTAQTPKRKIKEIMTARALERAYSKAEILEIYLNTMPF
ncbi:MAG TPA: biosynthetic peptidoglycan transglycosylase, partial [Rhodothermales bacterium]|nr:biosynthetic peptidoglycan transglycosylase [Rhodothermales bacterium]